MRSQGFCIQYSYYFAKEKYLDLKKMRDERLMIIGNKTVPRYIASCGWENAFMLRDALYNQIWYMQLKGVLNLIIQAA